VGLVVFGTAPGMFVVLTSAALMVMGSGAGLGAATAGFTAACWCQPSGRHQAVSTFHSSTTRVVCSCSGLKPGATPRSHVSIGTPAIGI
jgi:hypothetical protein